MKLLFKQRFFSWFDSYDIYNQGGGVEYTVQGKMSWGHRLEISDSTGRHVATLQQKILTLMPKFEIEIGGKYVGEIAKEFTLFTPSFKVDCNGWQVEGSFWEWSYYIENAQGGMVAQIEKEVLNFTDTYTIDVKNPDDALMSLMVVLAIDAVKCSQD